MNPDARRARRARAICTPSLASGCKMLSFFPLNVPESSQKSIFLIKVLTAESPVAIHSIFREMEHDTKNKHRISDARWRDSVARCYNLLKHCSEAETESTRMSILRQTLDQIQDRESRITDKTYLEQVKATFEQGENTEV